MYYFCYLTKKNLLDFFLASKRKKTSNSTDFDLNASILHFKGVNWGGRPLFDEINTPSSQMLLKSILDPLE